MPLVSQTEMLQRARSAGYAVGAFNISDVDTALAVLEAAETENAPVIIQIWGGVFDCTDPKALVSATRCIIESSPVPATLHLDHSLTIEQIEMGIDLGFSSVMIDGSTKPLAANEELVRAVVMMARASGVDTEAELGHVGSDYGGGEGALDRSVLTDPDEAREFVSNTQVDTLAVAIGTSHGLYRAEPSLDFQRLKEISQSIAIPLVLHGGSGVPDDQIRKAVERGISKINVATEMNAAFRDTLERALADNDYPEFPCMLMHPARKAMRDVAIRKIRLFGSSGKAK